VASFDIPAKAELARNALTVAGIQAVIADSEIVAMDWLISNAVGGVKVQVWEEDAERAAAVLAEQLGDEAGLISDAISEEELTRQALEAGDPDDEEPDSDE
jgi:hypothetical protein